MQMNHAMSAADFLPVFVMWAVMMTAMMLPAVSPVVLLFAKTNASGGGRSTSPPVAFFVVGYLMVLLAFSVGAAALQIGLHRAALLSTDMQLASRPLAAAVLVGAGLFQFTPLKHACLSQCRSPLGSLLGYWRHGPYGALLMGLRHGAFCLGCCWAEMLVLFVVGVMNIGWIALLAAFVILEKISSQGVLISRTGGAVMVFAGFVLVMS